MLKEIPNSTKFPFEPQHKKHEGPKRLKLACTFAQIDQCLLSTHRNFASLSIQTVPSEDCDKTV